MWTHDFHEVEFVMSPTRPWYHAADAAADSLESRGCGLKRRVSARADRLRGPKHAHVGPRGNRSREPGGIAAPRAPGRSLFPGRGPGPRASVFGTARPRPSQRGVLAGAYGGDPVP